MKPKPADSYHHGDLRQALIDAALAVAADRGVAAIRVSALAKQLGVSSGAPFRHFKSRTALLVAAAEQAAQQQHAALAAAARDAQDPADTQRQMGVAYVRWAVAHPGAFRVLSQIEVLRSSETLQAQNQAFQDQMEAAFDTGSRRLLSGESATVLAARALMFGLATMIVDGFLGEIDPDTAATLADEVASTLGSGLG